METEQRGRTLRVLIDLRESFDLRHESRGLTGAGAERLDKFLPGQ